MKRIKQVYKINAPVEKVWNALVNPKSIEKWGAGPAKMRAEEGFEFKLWGGEIFGKNLSVVPNEKLVQEWFSEDWKKPSLVTFTLREADGETIVELTHKDIPDEEFKDIEQGWKDYYMLPLKELVEKES